MESIHPSDGQETVTTPSPIKNSDREVVVVNVPFPFDNDVSPQRQVHVQAQDGSAKESKEIEVTYNSKIHKFKIKEEADKEPHGDPSTPATGYPTQERSVTSGREEVARRTPPKETKDRFMVLIQTKRQESDSNTD